VDHHWPGDGNEISTFRAVALNNIGAYKAAKEETTKQFDALDRKANKHGLATALIKYKSRFADPTEEQREFQSDTVARGKQLDAYQTHFENEGDSHHANLAHGHSRVNHYTGEVATLYPYKHPDYDNAKTDRSHLDYYHRQVVKIKNEHGL
jgi:hypothetical protein